MPKGERLVYFALFALLVGPFLFGVAVAALGYVRALQEGNVPFLLVSGGALLLMIGMVVSARWKERHQKVRTLTKSNKPH